jgi:hypothetical protein
MLPLLLFSRTVTGSALCLQLEAMMDCLVISDVPFFSRRVELDGLYNTS